MTRNNIRGIIIKLRSEDGFGGVNWNGYKVVDEIVEFKTGIRMIKIHHSELPIVREGEEYPLYWKWQAAELFPYLFKDTNPLLYRKFYDRKSWKVLELEKEYNDIYNTLFLR